MNSYFAVVFCDLVRHSVAWSRVPRGAMVGIIAEYRYLAQSIASQYGRRHENFAGDGHLFLFESADVAVHFGLKLIGFWKQRRRSLLALHNAPELPLRVGCHFGECTQLGDADAWVGRAINLAKQVEDSAMPDSLFVTQSVVDLIDLPFYEFDEAGMHELKGDYLLQRHLYRLLSVDQAALEQRPQEELTAEDWFLKGVALVGSSARTPKRRRSATARPCAGAPTTRKRTITWRYCSGHAVTRTPPPNITRKRLSCGHNIQKHITIMRSCWRQPTTPPTR